MTNIRLPHANAFATSCEAFNASCNHVCCVVQLCLPPYVITHANSANAFAVKGTYCTCETHSREAVTQDGERIRMRE